MTASALIFAIGNESRGNDALAPLLVRGLESTAEIAGRVELIEDYQLQVEHVTDLLDKQISISKQIRTLEKLRDTLLPKLMSGEMRVELVPDTQGRTYNRANVAE